MSKKKKQIAEEPDFLYYNLLPWEVNWAADYARQSNDKFKNYPQLNFRTDDVRILNAFTGAAGEFAFKEMLSDETRKLLREWPAENNALGSYYDFLFDNGAGQNVTVDVKTTASYSDYVHSPEECNFFYPKEWADQKKARGIPLCDIYIQMYYDMKEHRAFFIGAISLSKLCDLEKERSTWNGGFKVLQSEMDLTAKWLPYLTNRSN